MPDHPSLASSGATLEFIQNQASQSRRARPPDPHSGGGGYGERVPLKPGADKKPRKRESRLGLRNIFGWSKDTADADKASSAAPAVSSQVPATEPPQRQRRIRTSLAEINWPYTLHSQRSENALPSLSLPLSPHLKHRSSASVVRGQTMPGSPKSPAAPWDPPPLFKAYPQAIRHAHLSACTASAETVLRMHRSTFSQSSITLDMVEEVGAETNDKSRWKHGRNSSGASLKLEWTTKIFVLVTSGCLLQYTGEGSFDRLPEKVLHLGKDSAAFASDVIPGRHWVLQVSSVAETEKGVPSHAASLISRIPFRVHERRQASNLLMVFDNAEEMDGWITTVRREIETKGGRKHLSETGKPKLDEIESQLRSQTSQRTLVVRDPDRFSRILSPELPWDPRRASGSTDHHLDIADSDIRDQSFDDTSTASGISHDGRQLDGLRDSTNRLSYISSGQRTVITSAGSSPACSPVRDSFAGPDESHIPELQLQEDASKPRARPNAAAISDRRQSMQAMNHLLELRLASAQVIRPHSALSGSWQPEPFQPPQTARQTIPNFNAPQSMMGRRYLQGRIISLEPIQTTAPIPARASSRGPPPTAFTVNGRPLSLVEDQPSPLPISISEEDPLSSTSTDTPSLLSPGMPDFVTESKCTSAADLPDTLPDAADCGHQRHHSSSSVRTSFRSGLASDRSQTPTLTLPEKAPPPEPHSPLSPPRPQYIIRPNSSMGCHVRAQSPAPLRGNQALRRRRLSLCAQDTEKPAFDHREFPIRSRAPSLKPVPRSSQHLKNDSLSTNLPQRRSLSQLAENPPPGPPPGPPPTRALPPIPRKLARTSLPQTAGVMP